MSSTTPPPAAQRQALVKVAGIPGYFATKTGGNTSGEATEVWDGGSLEPDVIGGPAGPDEVTVSRPYRPARDRAVLKDLRQKVMRWRTTVSVTDTDEDLVAEGEPTVYAEALLTSVNEPERDASSGDGAMMELVFRPRSVV